MISSTANYLWCVDDVLGQGATASVFKARTKVTVLWFGSSRLKIVLYNLQKRHASSTYLTPSSHTVKVLSYFLYLPIMSDFTLMCKTVVCGGRMLCDMVVYGKILTFYGCVRVHREPVNGWQ